MKKLIQKGNTKLSSMYMFNIPANMEICARACPGCYAIKEQKRFPSVRTARQQRYDFSLQENFPARITSELSSLRKKPKYFRIHASGEFYSQAYINHWVTILKNNPDIIFFAYTKRLKEFNFSELVGCENMRLINSFHFKKINYGKKDKIPSGAFVCPDHLNETTCGTTCTYCMEKTGANKNGVFFIQH